VRLPGSITAVLFDLDGVLTDTATVHRRAWEQAFDTLLDELGVSPPFDPVEDYLRHVDGRSRLDGVRAFLRSREIALPAGAPDDEPGAHTVHGVGRRKNAVLHDLLRAEGITPYPGSVAFVHRVRERGLGSAVVSSSANAREVLRAAGLEDCFDAWVDGHRIAEDAIPGKPAPDSFLTAARDLGVAAAHAAVVEDALAGVEAGRAGGFGCVVGVDRDDQADALREHGADLVVADLDELELPG
jgi:beta-phosphoglucomutase family hydrolase